MIVEPEPLRANGFIGGGGGVIGIVDGTFPVAYQHPLKQFEGIPVYIYVPAGQNGNTEDLYLGFYQLGGIKLLSANPLQIGENFKYQIMQQWYLKYGGFDYFSIESRLKELSLSELAGLYGYSSHTFDNIPSASAYFMGISFENHAQPSGQPSPLKQWSATPCYFNITETTTGSGRNRISPTPSMLPSGNNNKYFLRNTYNEQWVPFVANDNSQYREFMISPVEEFELSQISYSLRSGDGALPIPSFVDEVVVSNRSGQAQSMSVNFTRKAVETSTFSKAANISMSIKQSASVSVPVIGVGASLDITNTAGATWTFGESEAKEDSRAYNFTLTVPPYSNYRATISVAMYDATATYTAVYRGVNTGRTVALTGKWTGIKASLITYDIYDFSGNHLAKVQGVPNRKLNLAEIKDQAVLSFE